MQPNLIKIERLYQSKKAININNKLAKMLGFEDMRDLFAEIHAWGYNKDFTYQNSEYDMQKFLRLFLKDNYITAN